jgi:hypothetical protein
MATDLKSKEGATQNVSPSLSRKFWGMTSRPLVSRLWLKDPINRVDLDFPAFFGVSVLMAF